MYQNIVFVNNYVQPWICFPSWLFTLYVKEYFESFIYNQLMLLMAEILRKYPVEVGRWNLPWFTTGFIYIQKVAFSPDSFSTINGIYTGPKKTKMTMENTDEKTQNYHEWGNFSQPKSILNHQQ